MNTTLHDTARKPLFARGTGLGLNFLALALLSVTLMVTDSRGGALAPLRAWTTWALQPMTWVAATPQVFTHLGEGFRGRDQLLAENRLLHERQLELEGRLLKMEALESENARIRALLSSAASLEDRVLIAEILEVSQDPYRHQILLNKGERDGVYKGQALVDASGIMGQVIQVNPTSSVALLITDPDHGLPVELNRTGLQTIALGRGDGEGLSLPYLPGNADVKVGDLLVSSGLGGRFPAGYPVGEIHELRHPAGENFMEAIAYPSARLSQGRQALLVWSERRSSGADAAEPGLPIQPAIGSAHRAEGRLSDKAGDAASKSDASAASSGQTAAQPAGTGTLNPAAKVEATSAGSASATRAAIVPSGATKAPPVKAQPAKAAAVKPTTPSGPDHPPKPVASNSVNRSENPAPAR